jgi:hypothetical protein
VRDQVNGGACTEAGNEEHQNGRLGENHIASILCSLHDSLSSRDTNFDESVDMPESR